MRDMKTVVDLALAVHALAALRLAHQPGKTVLEHAGANPRQHMRAAGFFQDDGIDALQVQKLGQQKSGRSAADDANLDLHRVSSTLVMSCHAWTFLVEFAARRMD